VAQQQRFQRRVAASSSREESLLIHNARIYLFDESDTIADAITDRSGRWAEQPPAARRALSLRKYIERSPRNLWSVGYITFTGLPHDRFLRPTRVPEYADKTRSISRLSALLCGQSLPRWPLGRFPR
jgi:hypothetical protein